MEYKFSRLRHYLKPKSLFTCASYMQISVDRPRTNQLSYFVWNYYYKSIKLKFRNKNRTISLPWGFEMLFFFIRFILILSQVFRSSKTYYAITAEHVWDYKWRWRWILILGDVRSPFQPFINAAQINLIIDRLIQCDQQRLP